MRDYIKPGFESDIIFEIEHLETQMRKLMKQFEESGDERLLFKRNKMVPIRRKLI